MTHDELIALGEDARRVLENPAYMKAFADVREGILQRIEAAPLRDHEGVHQLKLMLKLLRDVDGNLRRAMSDGKVLKVTIEEERRRKFSLANVFNIKD